MSSLHGEDRRERRTRKRLSETGERGAAKTIALPALLLIALFGYAQQETPSPRQDNESGPFRIAVDVALVVLHATVIDREGGGLASNLGEADFRIYEDGVPQRIRLFKNEDIPVTVGLVIDHSTTMRSKLAEVTAAARTFVRSSNPDDEMFIVNFNEAASGLPGAVPFTNSADELERAIATAPTEGMTALYDAIAEAFQKLRTGSRDKKALIVISDGGDNASALSFAQIMRLAAQSSAVIYTIGIFDEGDPDRNPRVLRRLAAASGGEAFFPRRVSEVVPICERIARDIRHQYTIGYAPLNLARQGAYHAIRVTAQAKGYGRLSVRARTGYMAGADPELGKVK